MNRIEIAKEVIDKEINGLLRLKEQIGEEFDKLIEICQQTLAAGGKIVLTGVGKSAHISRKIAATLISTGTKAAFLHPTEARHGDLGLLDSKDLVLAVSYSGETDELLVALPAMKAIGVKIIAVTGNVKSRLSQEALFSVPMKVDGEACPFGLAPTVSTTALLALGDAIALTLMREAGFTKNDYGKLHPAGAIGKTLTITAKDLMRELDYNVIRVDEKFRVSTSGLLPPIESFKLLPMKDVSDMMIRQRIDMAVAMKLDNTIVGVVLLDDLLQREIGIGHFFDGSCVLEVPMFKESTTGVEIAESFRKTHFPIAFVLDSVGEPVGQIMPQDISSLKI